MRRVLVALIALAVLAPSASAAASYRCRFDRFVRIHCCCPAEAAKKPHQAPAESVVRAQCCQVTAPDPGAQPVPPGVQPVDEHQLLGAATAAVPVAMAAPVRRLALDRSHAVHDPPPPDLYARHCALLL